MKIVVNVLGIAAFLFGALWVLQGTGVLKFGSMVGHSQWTYIGMVLASIGVVLLIIANRSRAKA